MPAPDFIKTLDHLGFTTRLKRISDALMHEGRRLYAELGVDIEPNWLVIFKLLQSQGSMSVTEIAECIKMSHPSVIAITNKMIANEYLISEKDKVDSRKRALSLSDKAMKKLPEYEKIWAAGDTVIKEVTEGFAALEFIDHIESKFSDMGFSERVQDHLKTK